MKILIFVQDESYAKGLRYFMQQAGHQVLLISEETSLADALKRERPDCLVVGQEMIEVAGTRLFSAPGAHVPLPFIAPIECVQDKPVESLEAEPSKLYSELHRQKTEELLNRFRKLRRGRTSLIRVGTLSLNFDQKRALFCGKALRLTPLQFKLLSTLVLNAERVVAYQELLEQVWGIEGDDEEARELLKVHINRIRQKMKATAPEEKPYIHVVRGFGYMLSRPDKGVSIR